MLAIETCGPEIDEQMVNRVFRAQVFNIFNKPQFDNPNESGATAGQRPSAFQARAR